MAVPGESVVPLLVLAAAAALMGTVLCLVCANLLVTGVLSALFRRTGGRDRAGPDGGPARPDGGDRRGRGEGDGPQGATDYPS
jgi:hypothetical protein